MDDPMNDPGPCALDRMDIQGLPAPRFKAADPCHDPHYFGPHGQLPLWFLVFLRAFLPVRWGPTLP